MFTRGRAELVLVRRSARVLHTRVEESCVAFMVNIGMNVRKVSATRSDGSCGQSGVCLPLELSVDPTLREGALSEVC